MSNKTYDKDLGPKDKEIVAGLVEKANTHLRKSALEIIEFGKVLIQLKEFLDGKGTFNLCVKEEFGMTKATASNFMRAAELFGEISSESETGKIILRLLPTVLITLAAPSTPSKVISEVFDLVKAGNKIKVDDVKRMIRDNKESDTPSNNLEPKSVFDDPEESDRKDIEIIEARVRDKMETIIKEVDEVTKDLAVLFKKFPNKETFFEKAYLFFTIKKLSQDALRVLKSLITPEKFKEFFRAKITELSA